MNFKIIPLVTLTVFLAGLMTMAPNEVRAQYYKGKTIEFLIGYSAKGGYNRYSRTLAEFMTKHIPGNPKIVPKNMPGAGSLKLTNYLYNVARKDGTVIGMIGRGMAMEPLLGGANTRFQADKFNWLGSMNNEVSICASWHTSPVKTWNDLQRTELIVGGTGSGADTDTFPVVLRNILGAKLKLISGYPGGGDILLAMERGEVNGRCGWSWSSVKTRNYKWIEQKKVNILVQLSLAKHPDLPNVPLVMDLATTKKQKDILKLIFARQVIGRPVLAPPGVPAARVAILRRAFDDTLKDPAFLKKAKKRRMEINAVSGQEVTDIIREMYNSPKSIVENAKAAVKK